MSLPPLLISTGLLLGALLLGVTSALALAAVARRLGTWARWPLALMMKTLALFPLSALIWAGIGLWAGQWSLPVSSLMPAVGEADVTDFATRLAHLIWWWVPPVFFLSCPMTAELFVRRMIGISPLPVQVHRAGWFTLALLPVVEEAFHLPGALAGVIPALHSAGADSVLLAAWPLALLGIGWSGLVWAWHRTPAPHRPTAAERIREGAIAIGLSPAQAWKQHLLRGQIQRGVISLCAAIAFGTSLWTAYGCPGNAARSRDFYNAFRAALGDPLAPLQTALPFTLCALFFWFLGRIILPRPRQ